MLSYATKLLKLGTVIISMCYKTVSLFPNRMKMERLPSATFTWND